MVTDTFFAGAARRILRPLVRAMIGRGLTYPRLTEILKELYIDEAARSFGIEGKRMTDSRISVLTGLQRKDIKAHRTAEDAVEVPKSLGPVPRVVARWRTDPQFLGADGEPMPLPRSAEDGPSFDALVLDVGRDVHPRTILDEMVRLDLATLESEGDLVALREDSLLPSKDAEMLITYYASNLGDHAEAAAENLLAAPEPGRFFERAVHYNKLTPASVDALEALARKRQMTVLRELNGEALRRQRADAAHGEARERFRVGAFIFRRRDDEAGS